MIVHMQGEVVAAGLDSLTLQMGGFGVQVFVPAGLAKQSQAGEMVFLHTNMVVREDSWSIYGFEHEIERDFFILLLAVNGIGPRLALAILSTLSVDVIRRAVLSEQAELFTRVPGIGKKTGQSNAFFFDASSIRKFLIRSTASMIEYAIRVALIACMTEPKASASSEMSITPSSPKSLGFRLTPAARSLERSGHVR